MNNLLKRITTGAALLLLCSVGLYAQATLASTTLSAALTGTSASAQPGASTDIIYVASTSNFVQNSVGQWQTLLYVDFEAMDVVAVLNASAGQVQVLRGAYGTEATKHNSGATVNVGPPSYFLSTGGSGGEAADKHGACTAANELVTPWININDGVTSTCVGGLWRQSAPAQTITAAVVTDTAKASAELDMVTGTTGTTLTNVAGMVTTVVPGTYRYYINAPGVATANCGIKEAFKLTGTVLTTTDYTARAFTASGVVVTHGTTTSDQTLLMDSAAGVVINTVIEGVMLVGTGGTIQFQAAQHTAHADTASVYVGATMTFTRIL